MIRRASDDGDAPQQRGWDRDRKIQVGHIISTVALALTVVGMIVRVTQYTGGMEARLSVVESRQAVQHERDAMQDKSEAEGRAAIMTRFDRLENKLDRLAEVAYRRPQ